MTKSTFPHKNVFSGLKNDWVKLSELFSTLKKSKSNFPNFIQHKKWLKVLFFEFILTIKCCKDYFPNFSTIKNDKVQLSASFSAIKNDKVQLSELFPPIKIIMSNFLHFFPHKKLQSSNFRTFSDLKNDCKGQISKLFPNISE